MFTVSNILKAFACGLVALSSAASAYYPVYPVYYSRPVIQRVMVPTVRRYYVRPTPVYPVLRPAVIRAYRAMPRPRVRHMYIGAAYAPRFSFGFSF
ncbi:hypothetical protein H0X48_00050 [Candidatus Dependentiae bacterium]|nr:hypothetical protein [Candidatus Dependentiae bacterium]